MKLNVFYDILAKTAGKETKHDLEEHKWEEDINDYMSSRGFSRTMFIEGLFP